MTKVEFHPLFGTPGSERSNWNSHLPFDSSMEIFERATVWPNSGVVKLRDRSLLTKTVWDPAFLAGVAELRSFYRNFPLRMRGTFYVTGMLWGASYYHWMCDVLPRLVRDLPCLPADVQIILPSWLNASHEEWLKLIDFPFDRSIRFCGRRPWRVDELWHTNPIAMTGDHVALDILRVRDRILARVCNRGSETNDCRQRLFINRSPGQERSIENFQAIMPILHSLGFRIIEGDQLNVFDQVVTFSQAEFVVGPHGGGFTNILWCRPGTKVFEIFEPESVRRCYKTLSSILELDYHCAIGDRHRLIGETASMKIDPALFLAAVERLIVKLN